MTGAARGTTTRTPLNLAGATAASVAAGPLFMVGMVLGEWFGAPDRAVSFPFNPFWLLPIAIVGAAVTVVAAIIAMPVNLIGTAAMTWLGDRNPGAQLAVFWALAGATAFAAPVAALNLKWAETSPDRLVPFVFTGACCALICRRGLSRERQAISAP